MEAARQQMLIKSKEISMKDLEMISMRRFLRFSHDVDIDNFQEDQRHYAARSIPASQPPERELGVPRYRHHIAQKPESI